MVKFGTLVSQVVLDEPNRIYCGSNEPVTGHVTVRYDTSHWRKKQKDLPADLFGPLKLSVIFHGRAKTKITQSNGNSQSVYRGRAPLFHIVSEIHDGPYRSAPGETHRFPFAVRFPRTVEMSQAGGWKEDHRFDRTFSDDLPPSFAIDFNSFSRNFEAFTEYRMGSAAIMPGININILRLSEREEPQVLYEQPRTRVEDVDVANLIWLNQFKIQNAELLPETERPSGFKEKFRAMTHSDYFPEYHFEVSCIHPERLYLQEPIKFQLRVRPQADLCTAPLWPDLHLKFFVVTLKARTLVRASVQFLREPDSHAEEKVLSFVATEKDLPPGPFEKANDMTKRIVTGPLSGGPSSFTTFNIARSYQMQIKSVVAGAGKEFKSERCIPVEVCPPLTVPGPSTTGTASAATQGGEAIAGPSSARPAAPEGPDGLPRYEAQVEPPAYGEQKGT